MPASRMANSSRVLRPHHFKFQRSRGRLIRRLGLRRTYLSDCLSHFGHLPQSKKYCLECVQAIPWKASVDFEPPPSTALHRLVQARERYHTTASPTSNILPALRDLCRLPVRARLAFTSAPGAHCNPAKSPQFRRISALRPAPDQFDGSTLHHVRIVTPWLGLHSASGPQPARTLVSE